MFPTGDTRSSSGLIVLAAIGWSVVPLSIAAAADTSIHFNKDIRPIFAEHCVACHGGVKQAGGLSFVYRDNVLSGGESGQPAVVPGDVEASYLVDRVTDPDPESRMPPAEHGPPLSADEIERLKKWIAEGAKWETPWAFVPPQATPLPEVKHADWCREPLDRYVLARLESAGLEPSPPAERVEWLRRVSFDLIGLPPTFAEVEAFLRDEQPGAYERVVDRLLASPHFGERWASMWLDLARYADTTGYESRSAPRHLAVSRLGDSRVQRRHAVRRVHDQATGGRPARIADDRRPAGDGISSQHADQYRRRHRR